MQPTCTLNILYNNNYSNSLLTESNPIHDVPKCLTRNQSFTEQIIPSSQSTVCLTFIIPTLYFTVFVTFLVLLYISTYSSERIFALRNHGEKSITLIKLNLLQLYYFIWWVPISNVIEKISIIANR